MKVSGFTFIRNGQLLGYPFLASIRSLLPIVDEFVIALGESADETLELIQAINDPKIRIIQTTWCEHMRTKGFVYGQQKMIAQYNCTGDWAFYLEADEVIHEQDHVAITKAMQQHLINPEVEALVFNYYHFYGNSETYLHGHRWYRRAARIIKTSVRSIAPDGLWWEVLDEKGKLRYPKAAEVGCYMYHYGWVRPEEQINLKNEGATKYWKSSHKQVDYTQIDSSILRKFTGTHPAVVQSWLPPSSGLFQADPNYPLSSREKKDQFISKIEDRIGKQFTAEHFRLV